MIDEMKRYYFTYGSEGHPFVGGWSVVEAPDFHIAIQIFQAYHPNKEKGLLNCSTVYSEREFQRTKMAGPDGNFGVFCHEIITVRRETAAKDNRKEIAS